MVTIKDKERKKEARKEGKGWGDIGGEKYKKGKNLVLGFIISFGL